jgi:diguanylate cyclase (GGDEF)-like protein
MSRAQRASADSVLAALRHESDRPSNKARGGLTDSLTGLGNRGDWDRQFSRELARARRSGDPLSVVLLDLDGFKAFNESHGHQAGDRLLVGAAAAWGSELREVDVLCRWGGDEFAALLPNCPRDEADAVIARLAAATPDEQSCGAGAACWDGWETDDALLWRAAQALYNNKGLLQGPATGDGTDRLR